MMDPLLREDPWVQEYGDEREAKGKAETSRYHIEFIMQERFPALEGLAMDRLERIQDAETLEKIFAAIFAIQDEREARRYFLALQDEQ